MNSSIPVRSSNLFQDSLADSATDFRKMLQLPLKQIYEQDAENQSSSICQMMNSKKFTDLYRSSMHQNSYRQTKMFQIPQQDQSIHKSKDIQHASIFNTSEQQNCSSVSRRKKIQEIINSNLVDSFQAQPNFFDQLKCQSKLNNNSIQCSQINSIQRNSYLPSQRYANSRQLNIQCIPTLRFCSSFLESQGYLPNQSCESWIRNKQKQMKFNSSEESSTQFMRDSVKRKSMRDSKQFQDKIQVKIGSLGNLSNTLKNYGRQNIVRVKSLNKLQISQNSQKGSIPIHSRHQSMINSQNTLVKQLQSQKSSSKLENINHSQRNQHLFTKYNNIQELFHSNKSQQVQGQKYLQNFDHIQSEVSYLVKSYLTERIQPQLNTQNAKINENQIKEIKSMVMQIKSQLSQLTTKIDKKPSFDNILQPKIRVPSSKFQRYLFHKDNCYVPQQKNISYFVNKQNKKELLNYSQNRFRSTMNRLKKLKELINLNKKSKQNIISIKTIQNNKSNQSLKIDPTFPTFQKIPSSTISKQNIQKREYYSPPSIKNKPFYNFGSFKNFHSPQKCTFR